MIKHPNLFIPAKTVAAYVVNYFWQGFCFLDFKIQS